MSIATELQNLNDNILDAYTAIQGKGGTVPANKNMVGLPAAISSIPSGGVGIPREVSANGVFGYPAQRFTFSLPSDATDVGTYALYYAIRNCTSLTSVDLSSLTTVSGDYALYSAFYNCRNVASVDLSSLTIISGSEPFHDAFYNCRGITSLNFPALTTLSGTDAFYSAFNSCRGLTSASFPVLTDVSGYMALSYTFRTCTSLTSVSFPALTASSFGSNTNQFDYMLSGCSNVTVHFPAAIQSTIGSWTSVTNGFSGTNTTVLFDL